jgi:hypothetical protein
MQNIQQIPMEHMFIVLLLQRPKCVLTTLTVLSKIDIYGLNLLKREHT